MMEDFIVSRFFMDTMSLLIKNFVLWLHAKLIHSCSVKPAVDKRERQKMQKYSK